MKNDYHSFGKTIALHAGISAFSVDDQFSLLRDLMEQTGFTRELYTQESGISASAIDAAWKRAQAAKGAT